MKNSRFLVLSLLIAALPLSANCSSVITAQVTDFGVYGNGNLWITLDRSTDQAGCSTPYLEFASNTPAIKTVLATASLALATSLKVVVQVDSCHSTGQYGTGTFSGVRNGTLFGLKKS